MYTMCRVYMSRRSLLIKNQYSNRERGNSHSQHQEISTPREWEYLRGSSPGCSRPISSRRLYRGTRTEHGIDGFFRGLTEWSKHSQSNHRSRKEFLEDTPTGVPARVLNRLGLDVPVNGQMVSEEDEHKWTDEFEVAPDSLITKVHVSVILNERPRR